MKKVIGGKRYDTDTAERIGEHEYSHPGDFRWSCDTLYRKTTGEFFIHGKGGAASTYARDIGEGQREGGERIIPIAFDEAKKWAEEHLDADGYDKLFGKAPEDGGKKTISLSLSLAAIGKMKNLAAKQQLPVSEMVEKLIMSAAD